MYSRPNGSQSIRRGLAAGGREGIIILSFIFAKFLDDQTWLENKRIMEIIRQIEKKAVRVRSTPPPQTKGFTLVDHVKPEIGLPMARGLFHPPVRITVDDRVEMGQGDFETDALYRQQYVDEKTLRHRIRRALKGRTQVTLTQICQTYPVVIKLMKGVVYRDAQEAVW